MIRQKNKNRYKIIKRSSTWLFSMLMIMSSFLSATNIKAAVGSVTLGRSIPYSYNVTGSDGYNEHATVTNEIVADGEIAFCVQPGHVLSPGSGFDKSDYAGSQATMLSNIAYEGWVNSSQTPEDYLATQLYIWEFMGGKINSTSLPNWSSRKAQIAGKVAKHDVLPSFNTKNITLNVGESTTLTDSNGVFNQFSLYSADSLDVSKNGNSLTITGRIDSKDDAKISYTKFPVKYVGTSILYRTGSQNVAKLMLKDPLSIYINVHVNKYGQLNITKQDEDGTMVPNTSFQFSKNSDMSSPIGTYTTGADGSVLVEQLLPGTYYVQETAVPAHLVLDSSIKSVTIKPNETTSYLARNNWVKGKIAIRKTDSESGKQAPGATYAIFNKQNQEMERLVTTATGYVESGYLRFGDYYVKEVIAPDGYVLNDTQYPVTIATNEQKIDVTGNDIRVKGTVNISKEDSVTGKQPQGQDTSLAGAVYELRARNPILDPADKSVLYTKDAVVSTLTTDANANASVSELYLGDYYLKETKPSPGYNLDPTEYEVPLHYEGQNVPVVTKSQTVKERVIAQAFSLIKISDNGQADETDKLKGVEFTVKAKPDVDKVGFDKAPLAKNAQGKDTAILVTDEKGYALSDELPIGTYVVRETKTPTDHITIPDFTIVVDHDSRDPQPWRIFNDGKFKAVVSIVKKDAETGNTVALPGAKFKIKNTNTNKYVGFLKWNPLPHYVDSWTTDESGAVFTDDVLTYGNYQLEEVEAPVGYLLNTTPIPFKIEMNGAYQTLPDGKTPVITMTQEDTSVKGRIIVSKAGLALKGTEKDDKGDLRFTYEKRNLKGAVFEVYAREDIKAADNTGKIIYHKDDVVEELTTSSDGRATTKDLPLGAYIVKEKQAPYGYIHSDEVKNVDLVYKDPTTPIVFGNADYVNERQRIEVTTSVEDAETKAKLAGAEVSLYANRDVYNYDGDIIVKAGTKIESVVTGEDGNAVFMAGLSNDLTPEYSISPIISTFGTKTIKDLTKNTGESIKDPADNPVVGDNKTDSDKQQEFKLIGDPNSLYYVKETKAPTGYLLGDEIREYVDTKYTNQFEPVLYFPTDFANLAIKSYIKVNKVDYYDHNDVLKVAEFTLFEDPNCTKVIKTAKTDPLNGVALFDGLIFGTYYVKETKAPAGYGLSKEVVKVVIDDNWVNGSDKTRTIIYPDKPLPVAGGLSTGDNTQAAEWMILGIFSLLILSLLFAPKKRKNEEK